MQSEDLLLALAAGGVLDGLFPDLDLSFPKVRAALNADDIVHMCLKSIDNQPVLLNSLRRGLEYAELVIPVNPWL